MKKTLQAFRIAGFMLITFLGIEHSHVYAQDFLGQSPYESYGNVSMHLPPYLFEDCGLITITFKTEHDVLRKLVPEPLEVNDDGIIRFTVALNKIVGPVLYKYEEAYFSVPVSLEGKEGAYYPFRYIEEGESVVLGHEIYGFSEIYANINIAESSRMIRGSVIYDGQTILEITANLTGELNQYAVEFNPSVFGFRMIPSVKPYSGPDIKQLTHVEMTDVVVHEAYDGKGTMYINNRASGLQAGIPVGEVLGVEYLRIDHTLGYGEVVYDYLKAGEISASDINGGAGSGTYE